MKRQRWVVNPDLICYLCRKKDTDTQDWSSITIGAYSIDVCYECMRTVWDYFRGNHYHNRAEKERENG